MRTQSVVLSLATATFLSSCGGQGQLSGVGAETPPPQRPVGVPPKAELAAYALGPTSFRAPRDGMVWVINEANGQEVVTHRVSRNDVVEVIPERDRVQLNTHVIHDERLEEGDPYAVYFLPSGVWDGASGGDIEPYDAIPSTASSVATGLGRVEWRADRSGRIWVGDDELRRLIASRDVRAGDTIAIDAVNDQVKINEVVVLDQNLESTHLHTVFFR